MSTIRPIAADDLRFSADFARICVARVEKIQEQAYSETEYLGRVASFARELFIEMVKRLAVKPQILIDQEARLAADYARQCWFSRDCFGKTYTYFEHKGAVIAKNRDSNVIYFYTDDLDQKFTHDELFSDAVKFLDEEGLITVTEYKFKKDIGLQQSHLDPKKILPVSAKLTEKGKQYL